MDRPDGPTVQIIVIGYGFLDEMGRKRRQNHGGKYDEQAYVKDVINEYLEHLVEDFDIHLDIRVRFFQSAKEAHAYLYEPTTDFGKSRPIDIVFTRARTTSGYCAFEFYTLMTKNNVMFKGTHWYVYGIRGREAEVQEKLLKRFSRTDEFLHYIDISNLDQFEALIGLLLDRVEELVNIDYLITAKLAAKLDKGGQAVYSCE